MFTSRTTAILQALFVTFIWSLSWVLIKIGLEDIPPLLFAGLRYSSGSVCLLWLVLSRPQARQQITQITRRQWLLLMLLGLIYYTITQGAHFIALAYLPAVTLSLMINFTVVLVALSGFVIGEYPNRIQWLGIGLFILGAIIYFEPSALPDGVGLLIGGVGVAANAAASVLGRYVNRDTALSPLVITTVSMSIGALILLATGLVSQGMPALQTSSWLIIIWLAVVHTAFAFTLWNNTLRQLKAFESSLINNTMLIQIAILAWVFLGESISLIGGIGLACAATGVLIVQLGQRRATPVKPALKPSET
jgi:drug/metabolite transporter (DMT)-like permease